MNAIQAVIFDLDDTLYAERTFTFSGYRAVSEAFAERLAAPFDLYQRMRSLFDTPDRGRVFNVIVEESGAADAERLVIEMVETFRTHRPGIHLLPDAEAALSRLRPLYRLGIISDGYLVTQQAKVDALNLADRVDEIILTDRWGRDFWKPHPRAFEEMAARLGVGHTACAYVSDNVAKDFVAPNILGWKTVLVLRDGAVYRDAQAPPGGMPQATVASLDGLESLL